MRSHRLILLAAVMLALGYAWLRGAFDGLERARAQSPAPAVNTKGLALATFASGCFWCTEADFDKVPGVVSTTSGYIGGTTRNPTYQEVSAGRTGHAEAVQIAYDPAKVTYEQLLDHYWKNVDPLTPDRQFCDVGSQYRPAIFYHDEAQKTAAEASKARIQQRFKQPVVVQIVPAATFYQAEAYHQDYYKHNEVRYRYYRFACGRDRRLQQLWGDKTSNER
jgi:peptide-methionine (S)-S-oxide reductase